MASQPGKQTIAILILPNTSQSKSKQGIKFGQLMKYSKGYIENPVDTGRKWNVHKTFRRLPGRLLNVLCTFNLRPKFYEVRASSLLISFNVLR